MRYEGQPLESSLPRRLSSEGSSWGGGGGEREGGEGEGGGRRLEVTGGRAMSKFPGRVTPVI